MMSARNESRQDQPVTTAGHPKHIEAYPRETNAVRAGLPRYREAGQVMIRAMMMTIIAPTIATRTCSRKAFPNFGLMLN